MIVSVLSYDFTREFTSSETEFGIWRRLLENPKIET